MSLKDNLEIASLWKVFDKSKKLSRLIWALIFLLCGLNFAYETLNRFQLVLQPPKSAFVKLLLVPSLAFPAVTVCPGYRFRKSLASKFNHDKFGCERGTKSCDWDFRWNFMTHVENIFKSCRFKKTFNCYPNVEKRGKWRRALTSLGRCFTYDSDDTVNCGGDLNALEFTVDPMIWDKSESLDFSGIRIYIHDRDQVPLVEIGGVNVNEGASAVFSLEVKKYKWLYDKVKNPCVDSEGNSNYTQSKCIQNCIYQSAIQSARVHCKAPFMTSINLKSCKVSKEIGALTEKFEAIVKNGTQWNLCTKKCPEFCQRMTYTPITASLGFTNSNESLVKIKIYFRDMWQETITEIWDYNFEDFISDTGGSLNLFLGASVISLIQVCDYMIAKWISHVGKLGRRWRKWRKNQIVNKILIVQSKNLVQ